MRSLRTIMLALALIATAVAIFGAAGAQARTLGFDIWNLSSEPVQIKSLSAFTQPANEGPVFEQGPGKAPPPQVGEVLKPGQKMHVELERPFFGAQRIAEIGFAGPGGGYVFGAVLRTQFETVCQNEAPPHQCAVDGETIRYLDKPGSVHEIDATEIVGQREAILELCSQANECRFQPTKKPEETLGDPRVAGEVVSSCRTAIESDIERKDTVTTSNSFGVTVEASASFFELFKSAIKTTYKFEISESHEFAQKVPIPLQPYETGWVEHQPPVFRSRGNFNLKLGNTTWKINNVYFDTPNPAKSGHYEETSKHRNAAEIKMCKEHEEHGPGASPATLLPTSAAQTSRSGSGGADLMRGFGESNTFRGLAAADILIGGGGHDTLLGGPGSDWINGGPGEDTINGGSGADHIVDRSGPTTVNTGGNGNGVPDYVDVSDGMGDDTVICESPNSTVIADPRDQVSGPCGHVIRTPGAGGG